MNHRKVHLLAIVVLLLSGCAASVAQFNPIEQRSIPKVVRLKMNSTLMDNSADATRSSAINFEMFRAKVMNTTSIRFVEANEDASITISFGPVQQKATLAYFDKHTEQRFTMRITEGTGRVIYIVTGSLVGRVEGELASELNRIFVNVVIPVLQGQQPVKTTQGPSTVSVQSMM